MNSGKMFRSKDGHSYAITFVLATTLFLLWGVCNGMIDVLNKHFQNTLNVSKAQSALVQFSNYMGYFFMALPAGWLARRFGYKGGILVGLALIAAGAFWFIPATSIGTYWAFLVGLFILATGLTCLETVANPYTTVLGPPEMAAARINIAQSCNGVGWILGPLLGGHFVLSATGQANRSNDTLYLPYLLVGMLVLLLFLAFLFAKVPDVAAASEDDGAGASLASIWKRKHFVAGVAAQFLYVAAQTGIFSFFINYVVVDLPAIGPAAAALLPSNWTFVQDGVYRITERGASALLGGGGFGLFLAGRIIGSLGLRVWRPQRMLAAYAALNIVLMAAVIGKLGWVSVGALFASFFFMSIMFPTIFALGIHGLGVETKKASSYIVMAIVGGAVVPMLMGFIADRLSMRVGFVVPLICFAGIAAYGASWQRLCAKTR
jgi:FHS family L-fucose permease-like MFS transporter